jgi:hypothetical protein
VYFLDAFNCQSSIQGTTEVYSRVQYQNQSGTGHRLFPISLLRLPDNSCIPETYLSHTRCLLKPNHPPHTVNQQSKMTMMTILMILMVSTHLESMPSPSANSQMSLLLSINPIPNRPIHQIRHPPQIFHLG